MAVCLIDLNTGVDEAGSRGEHVAVREPYALWVTGSAARVHKVCKGSKQRWRREGEVVLYVSVEAPGRTQTNTRAHNAHITHTWTRSLLCFHGQDADGIYRHVTNRPNAGRLGQLFSQGQAGSFVAPFSDMGSAQQHSVTHEHRQTDKSAQAHIHIHTLIHTVGNACRRYSKRR